MQQRARVFISCGQRPELGEVAIARAVADTLIQLGFEPYIAIEEQTLSGLKENLFRKLEEAEYYLFIDFGREHLDGAEERRGSLFTHQELAIAAFLDKDVIAFRERGVRRFDGVIGILQANAQEFDFRELLPALVASEVQNRGWRTDWHNGLIIEPSAPVFDDAKIGASQHVGRFFHLLVRNGHCRRAAENCYGYLDWIRSEEGESLSKCETAELKWAGSLMPNVRIATSSSRRLDAFWVLHKQPSVPQFNLFTDSTRFVPQFAGTGTWLLRYTVTSSTVRGASRTFRAAFPDDLRGVCLEPAGPSEPAA